jgi:aspartate aminotransferase-like enzyme
LSDFGKYFLPGPTEVRPEVIEAMVRPVIGHRSREMEALMDRVAPRLRWLFRTERPVYVSTSSATGLMEAAIRNCAPRSVLSLVCGAFSERFYQIAVACGRDADRVSVELGESNEPDAVRDALERREYDAVTTVHSETSTGVLNPVEAIARTVQDVAPEALVLVDCVTSLASARVETDAWGLDFALAGSQKGIAVPPGLAFGVASQRAYDRSLATPGRGLYFSFEAFESAATARQTSNTPAVSLLYALDAQLARIELEGLEARWARHETMAERTWQWVAEMRERHDIELGVLATEGRRSPSVTCITLPEDLSGVDVARSMKARGFTIASGYAKLKERTIRIGHMGDHTVQELEALLEELGQVIVG